MENGVMAKRATTKKPAVVETTYTDQGWLNATVLIGEREQTRTTFNGSVRNLALMRRAMTGTAYQACALNATACVGQTLRLVMPDTAAKSHSFKSRPIGKTERERKAYQDYIRGQHEVKPTRKSMGYAEDAGDVVEIMEHPVLDLLRKPDPDMSGHDYLWFQYFCRQACGESYSWVDERINGTPTRMYTLWPQFTWPVIGGDRLIGAFRYGRNTSAIVEFDPADVIYIRQHPHPELPTRGYSWLESVAQFSDTENAAIQAEIARWRNGGNPSGVFKLGPETTDEQMRQFRASVRAQIAGVQKQGEYLIVKNADIIGTAKPHEMQYVQGLELSEKRTYDAAGVPESVYRLNAANLASATVGNRQYMMYTIHPTIRSAAEQLTEELLPRFGIAPGEAWFMYDNPVPEDVAEQAVRLLGGVQAGVVRPNEYRRLLGLDPLEDRVNVLRIGGMDLEGPRVVAMPAVTDAAATPAADVEDEEDDESETVESESADSDAGGREEPDSGSKSTPAVSQSQPQRVGDAGVIAHKAGICACGGCGTVAPELASKGVQNWLGPDELPAVMMQFARRMYEEVKAWYVRVYRLLIGIEPASMAVTPEMIAELKDIIQYVGGQAARGGALNVANQPGFIQAFAQAQGVTIPGGQVTIGEPSVVVDLPNTWAVEYAEKRALELAKTVPDTIVADVRANIAAALEAGQTPEQLQRSLYLQVPDLVPYQARRLAITETSHAFNAGAEERIAEAGLMSTWLLDPTLDNCPQCLAIANYPDNQAFDPREGAYDPTTGGRVKPGRVHPNCGCMGIAAVEAAPADSVPVNVGAMT